MTIRDGAILQVSKTGRLIYLGDGFARAEAWHPERNPLNGAAIPANDDPATGNGHWAALAGKPESVKLTDAQLAAWASKISGVMA